MDIDAFLAALPLRACCEPTTIRNLHFVTWRGKASPPYNGFSGVERLHLWQLVRWLEAQGALAMPDRCDICSSGHRVQRHSENYYDPQRAAFLCGSCHRLIHLRYWGRWEEWKAVCKQHDPREERWFSMLQPDQPDIAALLRSRYGHQVANLKRSSPLQTARHTSRCTIGKAFQQPAAFS